MIEKPIEYNGLVLNDRTKANLSISPSYWIPVENVDGLFDDEMSTESHPNPCATGEKHGQNLRRGKQLVLTGKIYGLGMDYLRTGQLALMQAFWDLAEHQLKFYFMPGGPQIYITCYKNQPLICTDAIEKADYHVQSWTVGLRADNPRMYQVSGGALWQSWQT